MSKKTVTPGTLESVFGSAFGLAFTTYWTWGVYNRGGPLFMVGIGALLVLTTLKGFFDSIKAFRKRRRDLQFYGEEKYTENVDYSRKDPWESGYGSETGKQETVFSGKLGDIYQYTDREGNIYCPYCGVKIAHDFEYCPKCGRKLPFQTNY